MLFYRLQPIDEKLEPEWQSYTYRNDSLAEAMLTDIKEEWGMEEKAEELENIEDWVEYNKVVKEVWWGLVNEGNKPTNAHTGVSCFADKHRMANYIDRQPYYTSEQFEVVEFEGKWADIPEGIDGEDIAVPKETIRRHTIDSFLEMAA